MHEGHSKGRFLVEDAYSSVYDVSCYLIDEKFLLLSVLLVFWIQFDLRLLVHSNEPSSCLLDSTDS